VHFIKEFADLDESKKATSDNILTKRLDDNYFVNIVFVFSIFEYD
jgi:hypothetical protein